MASQTLAQRIYRGIVVDSVSMENLPDVHITNKNRLQVSVTNIKGSFSILASPSDTLLFTCLGYRPVVLPLLFEEDVVLIRLRENVQLLANITVRASRLYPNKIEDRTRQEPKRMDPLQGFISPIDYFFWREERDRRKLAKYIRENNRTQTYRQVITDPVVMGIMTKAYGISEEKYFELLTQFNLKFSAVHYATDADEIMEALHAYFEKAVNR
ncbi:MAG: hypothetical protein KF687_07260 [Cyclobacteriaceae bacterium]|nr:hypothetical protein [Cyclobacteriaceae bacterium]